MQSQENHQTCILPFLYKLYLSTSLDAISKFWTVGNDTGQITTSTSKLQEKQKFGETYRLKWTSESIRKLQLKNLISLLLGILF